MSRAASLRRRRGPATRPATPRCRAAFRPSRMPCAPCLLANVRAQRTQTEPDDAIFEFRNTFPASFPAPYVACGGRWPMLSPKA
eukprot:7378636-Prymnesium_polylepis.1